MADSVGRCLTTRERAATLAALGIIVAVTAGWWALALWPVPGEVPSWLARTRAFCFGAAPHGLPSRAGWMLLIGEPIAMVTALAIVAGQAVSSALRAAGAGWPGRVTLVSTGLLVLGGLVAAGARIARVGGGPDASLTSISTEAVERMDEPTPPLDLRSSTGEAVTLERFRGRVVLVGFAFGHCETVCPTVIREILRARADLAGTSTAVLIVTLDPWRDTPGRLPAIAERWHLLGDAVLLGGSVADVERSLDAWNVARSRDSLTGNITHATPVYVVNERGRLAYRVPPYAGAIVRAVRDLSAAGRQL